MVRGSSNPYNMVMQMVNSNPQLAPVANMLKAGADPKAMFYQAASSMGVNPNDILNMLKG